MSNGETLGVNVRPAMWSYVEQVYEGMHSRAQANDDHLEWEGFTTRLFQELTIPVPYYGQILDALMRMGSIEQLRRGGGRSESLWALYKEPVYEEWLEVTKDVRTRPRANQLTALEQRVSSIEERIAGVDVLKALAELQLQLDILKGKKAS